MKISNGRELLAAADRIRPDRAGLGLGGTDDGWREVHRYVPEDGEDCREALVYVQRMPARSWRIACPALGIDLVTGSDSHELAHAIASAFASGMLGTYRPA